MFNPFFINQGPFNILDLLKLIKTKTQILEKHIIKDIKDLISADKNSITFFHSKKYQEQAKKTNALFCITTDNLKNYLPTNCKPLIVENVLISTSLVTEKFYPNSIEDEFDN